jgi:Zn-finger nucleic acid-binding protein
MQCPVDQTVLQMSERSGVEIDYCPTCRGVWLDRGELDKILDRAAAELPSSGPAADPRSGQDPSYQQPGYQQPGYQQSGYDPRYDQRDRRDQSGYSSGRQQGYDPRYQKKRKKSFLDELFD